MKKELNVNKKLLLPDEEEDIPPDGKKVTSRIKIKAPKQKDNKSVYYTIGEPMALDELVDPEKFKPGRFIANIILEKDASIDPAIILKIEITDADVQRAAGQNLKLAYHKRQKWNVWENEFPNQAGFVEVMLSEVGDPAIAISP